MSRYYFVILTALIFISCFNKNKETYSESSSGLELAMYQEFRMTRDPMLNYVPRERLAEAKAYMNRLSNMIWTGGRLSSLTWQERGPDNVAGRTRAILIDKRDPSGNTVFAGSVSGGIFKTTNFLSTSPTWTKVNDFLPNLAISNIVQDPLYPDTLYATTGEGWFNIDAVRGAGIYKSTDGGNTWSVMPSTAGFEYVQDMVIDRNGHFFVSLRNATTAESRGVLRSTDRGTTWTRVLGLPLPGFNTGRAADLEVASNGDVYASLGILSRSEVYKSSFAVHGVNTGAPGTWINITPSTPTVTQRVEIAVAPSDPQRVYLFMQDSATSQVLNVYRSVNGGVSWTSLPAPTALNNGANSQTWFNLIAAVDPANPDFIVAGGLDLARSTDGGNSWTTITTASTVHVDHHVLIFDGSNKLINGNDGGVYYCSNIQATNPVFVPKNKGYNVTQFYAADLHPGAGVNYFLAGAQDNGNQKFTQSGMNSTSAITGGDGGFCHIDQSNPQLQIVATTNNNYARSLNGGNSFSSLGSSINNDRGQFINPSDFDEAAKILYAGDDAGKYYCISGLNGIPTAISVASGAFGNQEVTAIKVDPFSPNTIWLGVSFGTPAGLPRVLKLSNANTSNPTVITVANIGNVANAAISCIDVDLNDANRILVTLSNFGVNSVWLSTNGGTVFSSIEGNLPDMPVRWGMFAPPNAELSGPGGGVGGILLATELGVWTTSQMLGAATQWIPNNSGLANVRTDMLRYRSSDHLLIAATHGRGLFSTTLPTIVTGIVNPPPATRDFIKFVSAQHNTLLIEPGTLSVTSYTVQIFTMQGQLLYEKQFPYRSVMLNLKPYPPGAYVLRCRGNRGEIYQQKFIR